MISILKRMRQHHEGVLRFGDHVEPVRFVLDPANGQPVLPVVGHVLDFESVVLFAPDDSLENPDCLQISGTPKELDPHREAACDRHGAYFGRPAHARWARLEVESVKQLDSIVDGDLVRLANPLARHEGRLCKAANEHAHAVATACEKLTSVKPEQPLVVGVDPWGIDVRARFGVIRMEFPQPVTTPEEGRDQLSRMLGVQLVIAPSSTSQLPGHTP